MKALSVQQPWANMIASGLKTIETRKWWTPYRGDLLICSSKRPAIEPAGAAICIVRLVDCRRLTPRDRDAAQCQDCPYAGMPLEEWGRAMCCPDHPGVRFYAWVFENIRPIMPFPVRGQLGLFEVEVPRADR